MVNNDLLECVYVVCLYVCVGNGMFVCMCDSTFVCVCDGMFVCVCVVVCLYVWVMVCLYVYMCVGIIAIDLFSAFQGITLQARPQLRNPRGIYLKSWRPRERSLSFV